MQAFAIGVILHQAALGTPCLLLPCRHQPECEGCESRAMDLGLGCRSPLQPVGLALCSQLAVCIPRQHPGGLEPDADLCLPLNLDSGTLQQGELQHV